MRFTEIRAQNAPIETLRRSLRSGKVAHAYLFAGPAGVGKALTAKSLASALNCTSDETDDSCDSCTHCRKINKDVHPDVFQVTLPDGKKSIPVEAIRELEQRFIARPHEGKAKVVIIDPADRMTDAAANALLKTLEEPRPGRFLILITSRVTSMLPTVRSRCQLLRFGNLPNEVVASLLQQRGIAEKEAAMATAFSSGSMDRAYAYLEKDLAGRVSALLRLISSATEQTPLNGLEVIESLRGGNSSARDEAIQLLEIAPTVLSELLWLKTHPNLPSSDSALVQLFGDRIVGLATCLSVKRIASFAFSFHNAFQGIMNNNMNPQLALESALMATRGKPDLVDAQNGMKRL